MKKNFNRILSLCLVLAMCFAMTAFASAAEITSDGGSATSSVTLSSTADGTLGGDSAATAMSVTVPTVLPIAVGTDGTVVHMTLYTAGSRHIGISRLREFLKLVISHTEAKLLFTLGIFIGQYAFFALKIKFHVLDAHGIFVKNVFSAVKLLLEIA